ncbi:type II toxin-antitoxin system VapC family toxin [Promethearchaeum syntrophicum]|uniref:Type II toxin-antitoxin system VapC family toxin n=1 Tax=Promethearchaeum syntrophicum TaxID=2594042 RepID=A0A5B9DAL7_9ARCH
MPVEIFLDTSFIISLFNKTDKNHNKAKEMILKTFENNANTVFVYSDYIFDELITFMKKKKISSSIIQKNGDKILKSKLWMKIPISETVFQKSWNMIKKFKDKSWSFTDVSSFVLMKQLNILYFLSYDTHFLQNPEISPWIISQEKS